MTSLKTTVLDIAFYLSYSLLYTNCFFNTRFAFYNYFIGGAEKGVTSFKRHSSLRCAIFKPYVARGIVKRLGP